MCGGVKEIDFQAANLRAIDFCCFEDNVRFSFSFVPKLEHVKIHPSKADTMSFFGDFARDLSAQVKSLTVRCCHEKMLTDRNEDVQKH